MHGINKLVRDSFFLRFAANEDTPPPEIQRSNSILWGVVAMLSLLLGMSLSGEPNLNAKEISIPALPVPYIEKSNILNTDFTIPLPALNIKANDYSCVSALETPPSLRDVWAPCVVRFNNNLYTVKPEV